MSQNGFSVLMSVYSKEEPNNLKLSIESVLNSSKIPDEIIIVEDGPLNKGLYDVLDFFSKSNQIKRVKLNKNEGLAKALSIVIEYCSNELIARMDTDDYCQYNRFEKQIDYFSKNKDLIIVGSNIGEFITNPSDLVSLKKMPISGKEIKKYSKTRNPFNHPSVMFKKSRISEVGGYKEMPLFEDYYLWLRLLHKFNDCQFLNIPENLVHMRISADAYKRRGGIHYIPKVWRFRMKCYKEGLISIFEAILLACIVSLNAIIPNKMRAIIYKRFLRITPKMFA